MTMLKVIEVLAQSDKSWEDAVQNAIDEVWMANSYSRGNGELEKATAMLFPSEIA